MAPPRRLLLCAPRRAVGDLGELIEAWNEAGIDLTTDLYEAAPPDPADLIAAADDRFDAALLMTPARRAPATVVRAPFATDRRGRRIPVALLPCRDDGSVRVFAASSARVHRRSRGRRAVAVLGQWQPRYLQVADRMHGLVAGNAQALRWTSDAITRESMVDALGSGLGLAVYVGHGRAVGWAGYHGVRSHHFAGAESAAKREPMGAILSLCCRTASRRRVALSFAEALPLGGVAAATFGAVVDTLHTDNTRWAVGVCNALADGVDTVGELLVRAAPVSPVALASYRLIGDPFAPVDCSERSLERAMGVPTYE